MTTKPPDWKRVGAKLERAEYAVYGAMAALGNRHGPDARLADRILQGVAGQISALRLHTFTRIPPRTKRLAERSGARR